MINKLYISTVDHDWSNTNLLYLHQQNLVKIIDHADSLDCYTSAEDLFCENISVACDHAKEIHVVELDQDVKINNNNCFLYGRLFNQLIRNKNKVYNFDFTKNFNQLLGARSTSDPVLWTVGCSVTFGLGLNSKQQRWGALLAEKMNINEITLSKSGSSIFYAADQVLRSDIRNGDVVVWGLTNVPRIEVSRDWNFDNNTIADYQQLEKDMQYWNLDYFESETQVLKAIRNILQVKNFCYKMNAKLYLVNLLDISWIGVAFSNSEKFIDLTQDLHVIGNTVYFTDLGTDGLHPGPLQHKQYAQKIFNFIKEDNHGQTI